MSEIAVKIENVSKEYRLGAIGGTTLRDDLQRARIISSSSSPQSVRKERESLISQAVIDYSPSNSSPVSPPELKLCAERVFTQPGRILAKPAMEVIAICSSCLSTSLP